MVKSTINGNFQWKTTILMGKSTINHHFPMVFLWFSYVYQRVMVFMVFFTLLFSSTRRDAVLIRSEFFDESQAFGAGYPWDPMDPKREVLEEWGTDDENRFRK